MTDQMLSARHCIANAASAVARVNADIARALAWRDQDTAAILDELEAAAKALDAARQALIEATVRVRMADEATED